VTAAAAYRAGRASRSDESLGDAAGDIREAPRRCAAATQLRRCERTARSGSS